MLPPDSDLTSYYSMCPHTIYVSSYFYKCVLILLYMQVLPPDLDRMSLTVRFNPFDDGAMQDGRQVQVQEGEKITGG